MIGQVRHTNPDGGMYSVLLGDGGFSVIETSEELERGELVRGDFKNHASETFSRADGTMFDGFVQAVDCSLFTAERMCFLR